jgi:electron transport complex protein RnfG
MEERKPILPPYILLCLVAIVMAFAIAGVYTLTKDTIEAAALEAQMAARTAVMADAYDMTELPLAEGDPVDYCYEAVDASGNVIGYVSQITVTGFGGEIEVTVGMDMTGTITAINVGGSNFSETSGLGAKTREAAFTDQFKGMSGMLVLKQNIDSVTGASVSSGAVVSGVNKALTYMTALLPEGSVSTTVEPVDLTAEELAQLVPGAVSAQWMGSGTGIDGWWQTDNGGYVVRATGFGEGPIVVTLGFTADGVVTGIIIGDDNFMETEGLGARVLEETYWSQFIGLQGAQTYGEGVDAISGATVTSNATLAAINVCLSFDPQNPGTATATTTTTTTTTVDAESSASVEEEETAVEPDPNPPVAAEADAETSASVVEEEPVATEVPDAQTEASIVEEETATPTPEPVDAVAEASVTEETAATPVPTVAPTPVPTEAPDAETSASVTEEEEATPTPAPTPDAVAEASVKE